MPQSPKLTRSTSEDIDEYSILTSRETIVGTISNLLISGSMLPVANV